MLLGAIAIASTGASVGAYMQHGASFLNALYMSISLFALNYTPPRGALGVTLEVARFVSPSVTVAAAVATGWTLLRDEVDGRRARRARHHVLVCGLGDHGLQFLKTFIVAGHRVVAIERDRTNPNIDAARELRVPVVIGDATQVGVLRGAGARRAARVICITDSDNTNAAIVAALRAIAPAEHQYVHCHVANPMLDAQLTARSMTSSDTGRDVEWFSVERLAAKALLSDFFSTLVQAKDAPGRQRGFAVVGATDTARSLLIEAAKQWRSLVVNEAQRDGDTGFDARLPVTVVAPGARAWLVDTNAAFQGLDTALDIRVVEKNPLSAAWSPSDSQVVFVAIDDPSEALAVGLHLDARRDPVKTDVVVRVCVDAAGLASATGADTQRGQVHVVNVIEMTCTVDLIERTLIEELARENHRVYTQNVPGLPASRTWAQLSEEYRESNRSAAAHHVREKLPAVGLCVVPIADLGDVGGVTLTDDEITALAESEHERWMMEKKDAGWHFEPERDPANQAHPDLQAWELLTHDVQEKDRMFVRALPQMLAACGYRLVHCRPAQGDNVA
jgi:voltage-gated potassium channel Kch